MFSDCFGLRTADAATVVRQELGLEVRMDLSRELLPEDTCRGFDREIGRGVAAAHLALRQMPRDFDDIGGRQLAQSPVPEIITRQMCHRLPILRASRARAAWRRLITCCLV